MKKVFIIVMLVLASVSTTIAENYERQCINRDYVELNIQDITDGQEFYYCKGIYDSIIVHGRTGFDNEWNVNGQFFFTESITLKEEEATYDLFNISHTAGGQANSFGFSFWDNHVPYPFSEPLIWKRQGESIRLHAHSYGFSIYWSTGDENTEDIEISQPGIYTVTINDNEFAGCVDNETFSVEVRDNVEIISASVYPNTNKNLVTWGTTSEQTDYISNVIINRDGVDMATVPYMDGHFMDNIGSDLAARVYTITGVCTDGTLCPIPSYQRGTIHMAFLPDINGNVEMTWNQPILDDAPIHINRFEICEYDPNSNEISVIDFVSSVTTSYSCNQSMFDYGYPLIRAVIEDGRGEKDMLSNRTEDLVGLNEMETGTLRVYPNPSNGVFNIEGEGTLHIANVLGQEVMSKEIDGKTTIELPQGMYFVKLGDVTRKVVVE